MQISRRKSESQHGIHIPYEYNGGVCSVEGVIQNNLAELSGNIDPVTLNIKVADGQIEEFMLDH